MKRCSVHEHWYVYCSLTINTLHSNTHKELVLICLFTCFRCSCSLKEQKELHSTRQVGFLSYCSLYRHSCLWTFQKLFSTCMKHHTIRHAVRRIFEKCFKLTIRYWSARAVIHTYWSNSQLSLNTSLFSDRYKQQAGALSQVPRCCERNIQKYLAIIDLLHGNLS